MLQYCYERAPQNTTSLGLTNDNLDQKEAIVALEKMDSDEDLCDIEFPIIDNTSTAHGGGEVSAKDSTHIQDISRPSTGNQVEVDEHAVINCFNLSVTAHIEGRSDIEAFEPKPPQKNNRKESKSPSKDKDEMKIQLSTQHKNTADNKRANQQEKNLTTKKSEWFPASLPLPSWANNI